jgi:TetR/AcrR family transcriptional repressor of nem operon
MARPLEFDRPQALSRAMLLFWRKGYQASSLTELLAAMGIGRSSFYGAFTDKRSLFVECLDLFASRSLALAARARGELPPMDALQRFFERHFTGARGARAHSGCLLVNTVLEMAGVDDALAARAGDHLADLERVFQACLRDAGAAPGQAQELAALLMLVNEGLRVSSRRPLPDAQHLLSIATTFRLIRGAIA